MSSLPCSVGNHDECPCSDKLEHIAMFYYHNGGLCGCDCHEYTDELKKSVIQWLLDNGYIKRKTEDEP